MARHNIHFRCKSITGIMQRAQSLTNSAATGRGRVVPGPMVPGYKPFSLDHEWLWREGGEDIQRERGRGRKREREKDEMNKEKQKRGRPCGFFLKEIVVSLVVRLGSTRRDERQMKGGHNAEQSSSWP